jgi:hypothetical protein
LIGSIDSKPYSAGKQKENNDFQILSGSAVQVMEVAKSKINQSQCKKKRKYGQYSKKNYKIFCCL